MVFHFSNPFFFFFFFFIFLIPLSSSSPSDDAQNFIVHVAKSHKPSLFSSHYHWYTSIIESLPSSPSSHASKLLYSYEKAIHGFSARLTAAQADKLRELPGILAVLPDEVLQLHTTRTPHFLGLDQNSGIWPNSDYADDIIIGVIDSGIWPEHPSFSDHGLSPTPWSWRGRCEVWPDFPFWACNRKLIGARSFYKGYEAHRKKPIDESQETKSPRDTKGHGTHTASTAAGAVVHNASFYNYARGQARGVATRARIAAYKVCWTTGCYSSDVLAGMDRAIADGVHVLSLSIGFPKTVQYHKDSVTVGSFGAVREGVVVSCSAGNDGPKPSTVSNLAPWVITVGASTIDREFPAEVVLGDGRVFSGVTLYAGDPLPNAQLPLIYGSEAGDQYCHSLESSNVTGKIVVCDRGKNERVVKGIVVKNAGGLGMILSNYNKKTLGEELNADPHLIPATMVGQADGNKIKKYIKQSESPTATIVFRGTVIGSKPAPMVSTFSSRGPNRITPQILKPDVIAPGVKILAAWSGAISPTKLVNDTRRVEFNLLSGSSMSCPHVSGIAAMLRKTYPHWSPAAIKSALMTTAYKLDNSGKPFYDIGTDNVSTPFMHGAGHVDPNTALNPGLVYDMKIDDYTAFLCSIGYDYRRLALFFGEIVGRHICETSVAVTGNLTSPGDLNYPSFSVVFNSSEDTVTYKRVVTNVGTSDAVYTVSVSAPSGVEIDVVPKKLVFSAKKLTQAYEVTFSSTGTYTEGSDKFGWIEWTDGSHHVRSPIAITWSTTESTYIASM